MVHMKMVHMCTINKDHMMYGSWDIKHNRHFFCHFGPFLHFEPPNNKKNQNLKKMKKKPGDIINLQLCITNDDQIINGSWDMEWDRQNFLFWAIFCPFTPLTTRKIIILKKQKKHPDTIILHLCTINNNHMMYGSYDTECDWQNFLSFCTIFCPFISRSP